MSGAGTVQSFNYEDVATSATATRQLASQDYMICFRRELVSSVVCTSSSYIPNAKCSCCYVGYI